MISGTNFGEAVGEVIDDLQLFFDALADGQVEDPDSESPTAWELYDTAFEWVAARVWMTWWITYRPERKVRIYVDKAGPTMRAHP